jgi:hypothetical protein
MMKGRRLLYILAVAAATVAQHSAIVAFQTHTTTIHLKRDRIEKRKVIQPFRLPMAIDDDDVSAHSVLIFCLLLSTFATTIPLHFIFM